MSEYIVELDSKHSIALKIAFVEEMRGGDFVREEIVRCRDCRWTKHDQSDNDYRREYRCNMWIADVSADGYCWRGMRKDVDA